MDTSAASRGVRDCRQAFARHVIHDVENAEAPAKGELIVHEVERSARIDLGFDQDRCECSDSSPPSLALANRQTFLAVEPIDAVDA